MRFLLLLFFISTIPSIGFSQIPDFYKEYISIEVKNGSVEINGIYQLRNNESFDQDMNLFYPFPSDPSYGEVGNIYAFERVNDSMINLHKSHSEKGSMVKLKMAPFSEKTLYIGYTQELLSNKAEYILTTTKKWKKPLESSEFELIVPEDYIIDSLSYQPDDSIVSGNRKHYFVRKANFMPDENFVVTFHAPE